MRPHQLTLHGPHHLQVMFRSSWKQVLVSEPSWKKGEGVEQGITFAPCPLHVLLYPSSPRARASPVFTTYVLPLLPINTLK